jgi:hypothetical protein
VAPSQYTDADFVKRQLDDINANLESERETAGSIVQRQAEEIETCKKELETKKENELKLRTRAFELQEELEQTLRRIDQLQRGVTTPSRRKSQQQQQTNSRGNSPYTRNSSNGSQKKGSAAKYSNNVVVASYTRPTRNLSNNKSSSLTRKPSPGPKQYPLPSNYKPPHLRTTNNRSGSNNNRSGSNNERTTVPAAQNKYAKPSSITVKPKEGMPTKVQTSVYDRLYGGGGINKTQTTNVGKGKGMQVLAS